MLKLSLNHFKLCIRSSPGLSLPKNSLNHHSAYRFSEKTEKEEEAELENLMRTPIARYNFITEERYLPISKQKTMRNLGIYSVATALSFAATPIWVTICPLFLTFMAGFKLGMISWRQSRHLMMKHRQNSEKTLGDMIYNKQGELIMFMYAGTLYYIGSLAAHSSFPEIAFLPLLASAFMGVAGGITLVTSMFKKDKYDFIKQEMEDAVFLQNKNYKYSSPTILSNDPDSQFFIWLKDNNPTKLDYIKPSLAALSGYALYEFDYKGMGMIVAYIAYTMVENRYWVWQRNKLWKDPFVSKILLEDGGNIKVYAMNNDTPFLCDLGKTKILDSDMNTFDVERVGQKAWRVEFFDIERKKYIPMNLYLENRTSTVENIPLLDDILRGDVSEVAKYKLVTAEEAKTL